MEHVAEATAETAVLGHVSHTYHIRTKNGIVWTAACHRAECHPYLEKSKLIVVGGWLYVYMYRKDATTKNEEKRETQNTRTRLSRILDPLFRHECTIERTLLFCAGPIEGCSPKAYAGYSGITAGRNATNVPLSIHRQTGTHTAQQAHRPAGRRHNSCVYTYTDGSTHVVGAHRREVHIHRAPIALQVSHHVPPSSKERGAANEETIGR